jgi:hypothetical protein
LRFIQYARPHLPSIVFFALGLAVYLNLNLYTPLDVKKYQPGESLYTDRNYKDEVGSFHRSGLQVVKVPRHLATAVRIESQSSFEAFIPIGANTNSKEYKSWKVLDEYFKVEGITLTHDKLVAKEFKAGAYLFEPASLIAASPLFIKTKDDGSIKASYVSSINRFRGPLLNYKKRLLSYALILIFINVLGNLLVSVRKKS